MTGNLEIKEAKEIEDENVILAYLEMLRIATDEQDMDEMDRVMALLEEFTYSKEMQAGIEELSSLIVNMDCDQAIEKIGELAEQLRSNGNGRREE